MKKVIIFALVAIGVYASCIMANNPFPQYSEVENQRVVVEEWI